MDLQSPAGSSLVASLRETIAHFFFGDIIDTATRQALAAVSVRVDDSPGWDSHTPGPADKPWHERHDDLEDALEAWRKNFLVRRIVTLIRSYVVGNGISLSSKLPDVDDFLSAFWNHPQNLVDRRLGPMCDELARAGEIFPILFTNRADGMSYVRFVPAERVRVIECDPEDYETEVRYGEIQESEIEPRWWVGPGHRHAYRRARGGTGGKLMPLMLHFTVNRPIGATRGESDLTPILPWAKRYSGWLADRVRLNRQRTRQLLLDVEIADETQVETKRQQLRTHNPTEAGIYVHGPGEVVTAHALKIEADDAEKDGKTLRLAVATGANTALHYFGEGEGTNYATAKEMGEPTARFYTERQQAFCWQLQSLATAAYRRKCALGLAAWPADDDLQIEVNTTEVARADNAGLASAARDIVQALQGMRDEGWVDDATAVRLAFKFAGELISEEEISRILAENGPRGAGARSEQSEETETKGESQDE